MGCSQSSRLDAATRSVACRPQSRIVACPPQLYSSPQHTLTARIVKPARTAATDLNTKHHTHQVGGWGALRAVGSTLRRSLSVACRPQSRIAARPPWLYTEVTAPRADGTDRKTCSHGGD